MTRLIRNTLERPIRDSLQSGGAHTGLLLQKGWPRFISGNDENDQTKSNHIRHLAAMQCSSLYSNAYQRWLRATVDHCRFRLRALQLQGRLLTGLAGSGALETGCSIHQTYGMPYLPGTSIKGVVRHWAENNLPEQMERLNMLFGQQDSSGLVVFHDAWWIPESGSLGKENQPFCEEVVTTHHPDYYGNQGSEPATDLDSPVPNAMLGVQGGFLFTLEGDEKITKLIMQMLETALAEQGIGAKTAAGFGYFSICDELNQLVTKRLKKARLEALPVDKQAEEEMKYLSENELLKMFVGDFDKTQSRSDYSELISQFERQQPEVYQAWKSADKKTQKMRFRAYRNLARSVKEPDGDLG